MTDFLSQENVDQFRQAMRDVADTFNQVPVILLRADGTEIPLLAGVKSDDAGSYGRVDGEIYQQEERIEQVERRILRFNYDYLQEQGLIAVGGQLAITLDDRFVIDGKRFQVMKGAAKGYFRDEPLVAAIEVQR